MKKYNFKNVYAYLQGMFRYNLFYTKFKWLIRPHIVEQILFRIEVMDKECLEFGSCKLCGCKTTALQMANKMCDKPCYPVMLDKITWKGFKMSDIYIDRKNRLKWVYSNNKLYCVKYDK